MADARPYRSRAVRALVLLHHEHMRRFLETWRRAVDADVTLPCTPDPAYASLPSLAHHVLGAAGGYLEWICDQLALPNPQVGPAPDTQTVLHDADTYLEHVLERWQSGPLVEVADSQLETPEYPTTWQTRYAIDSMLEHAVMHPIRHTFQLEELIAGQNRG